MSDNNNNYYYYNIRCMYTEHCIDNANYTIQVHNYIPTNYYNNFHGIDDIL